MDQQAPYNYFIVVVPSDTVNMERMCDAIYVGGAGDLTIVPQNDKVMTFKAVPLGTVLWVQAKRVNATATTATNLVALHYL